MLKTYAQLMALANDYAGSKALLVANELGLFTAIGAEWRTVEDLAIRCKADREGLRLLLNALVGMDLLRLRCRRYGNTVLGRHYLDGNSPTAITNLLWLLNHHWSDWTDMAATIRSGRRGWAALTARSSFRRRFALAMHERSHILAPPTIAAMRIPRGATRFLDVAGGPGSYAVALARRYPGLTGMIVDQHVATAKALIRRHDLQRRLTLRRGDVFSADFGNGYDAALAANILHDFNERENQALLGRIHAALRPDGKLFIVEFFLDKTLTGPTEAAVFSLVMYKFTASGRSYGWAEVEGWLRALGFGRFRRRRITTGVGLLEATKTQRKDPS
ncbi:MAG: methyltransferase domain-containing protein [Nitrospirae bacterium]|nr:MAG: methyltransferase domain-containing protein [Nitrospirota bacterium]